MPRSRRPSCAVVALVALLASGCAWITRASVDTAAGDADDSSFPPSISADGRFVAFHSDASDLVSGDGNHFRDVFVRTCGPAATTRVSVDTVGGDPDAPSNGDSEFNDIRPSISADGRFVAFASRWRTIWWPATATRRRTSSSRRSGGTTVRAASTSRRRLQHGQLSAVDQRRRPHRCLCLGRRAIWWRNDRNGVADVFVRPRQTVRPPGQPRRHRRWPQRRRPAVDRPRTAGTSRSPRQVGPLANVFVRDLQTGSTTRVSVDTAGGDPNAQSFSPSISADGPHGCVRIDGERPGARRQQRRRGRVRARPANRQPQAGQRRQRRGSPNAQSFSPSISADGRTVAFESTASDLVPGDSNGVDDVFVRDLRTGTTDAAQRRHVGREVIGASERPSISADGHVVAFVSVAVGLVPGDENPAPDVFVRAVVTPTVDSVTPDTVARGSTATLTIGGSGFLERRGGLGVVLRPGRCDRGGRRSRSVSETELEVSVTVSAAAPTGTRNLAVWNPGTGPGVIGRFRRLHRCLIVTWERPIRSASPKRGSCRTQPSSGRLTTTRSGACL